MNRRIVGAIRAWIARWKAATIGAITTPEGRSTITTEGDRTMTDHHTIAQAIADRHSVIHSPDSLKMLRETLCVAQWAVNSSSQYMRTAHGERIQRLIDDIDHQRPLGQNGKHGDLHTDTCGCDDE